MGRKDWDPRRFRMKFKDAPLHPAFRKALREGAALRALGLEAVEEFFTGYLDTAIATEEDFGTTEPLRLYSPWDLTPKAMQEILWEGFQFLEDHHEHMDRRFREAGAAFWLAHQEGKEFDWKVWGTDAATRLTNDAVHYPSVSLYVGEDGKIHRM